MSDTYYRERAARRARITWLVIIVVFSVGCLAFSAYRIFYDECTKSFARNPEAILRSYIQAIANGDAEQARSCWVDNAYFDLESGCSEICISHILKTQYVVNTIDFSTETITSDSRANLQASISLTCPGSSQQHTAQVTLDSIPQKVPWQHWKIISSDLGGTLSEPWCQ
jgi:hypothetical protein